MVNLTEIWATVGKPEGRRPSNFKATAAIQRFLAAHPTEWVVTGRGAKAITSASERLADEYRAYVQTAKRGSTKATSTGSSTGASTGASTGGYAGYTADDLQKAYNAGASNGYRSGYEAGLRDGQARGAQPDAETFRRGFRTVRVHFSMRNHPDRNRGREAQASYDMSIINAVLDEIEKVFTKAA